MNTFLFDLDGTLLPMDQSLFLKRYFQELAEKGSELGYDPELLTKAVWAGTKAMAANDGSMSNKERFWQTAASLLGDRVYEDIPAFDAFYENEFHRIQEVAHPNQKANQCVKHLKKKGYTLVLATNPMFPRAGTASRIQWAGLDAEDFALITTYEDFHYCKPNPAYYQSILEKIGKQPQECIMVGNDALEDLCAAQLGMEVFLLTDFLVNEEHADLSQVRCGSMDDFFDFVQQLPEVK